MFDFEPDTTEHDDGVRQSAIFSLHARVMLWTIVIDFEAFFCSSSLVLTLFGLQQLSTIHFLLSVPCRTHVDDFARNRCQQNAVSAIHATRVGTGSTCCVRRG